MADGGLGSANRKPTVAARNHGPDRSRPQRSGAMRSAMRHARLCLCLDPHIWYLDGMYLLNICHLGSGSVCGACRRWRWQWQWEMGF
jgi:hypothetical protein